MPVRIWGAGGRSGIKGYSISPCTNLKIVAGDGKATLTWVDPEDTVVNGETVAPWTSTKVVRKVGSFPTGIKDGTLVLESKNKNQYSSDGFVDTDIINGTTYYYSVFATSNGVASDDVSASVTPMSYSTTLKDNTWDQISEASEAGIASSLWNIGDEIDVEVAGGTYTFQIYGFDIDDKADGSGKAGITFGMKNLLNDTSVISSNSYYFPSTWSNTPLRETIMGYYDNMQSDVRSVIKTVNKISGVKSSSSVGLTNIITQDNLFIFSVKELNCTLDSMTGNEYSDDRIQTYPIFTDDNSRIKKLNNGLGSANGWWMRTPVWQDNSYWGRIKSTGIPNYDYGTNPYGICLGFCV